MNSVVGPLQYACNACMNKIQYMCKRLQFVSKWEFNTCSTLGKWFSLGLDALILPHREFELCVRTEESWPLSWTAKSRWAGRSLKMCFACLVTLKAISCHSYSVHWQRRIAPWQIALATGPYMHWTFKLAWGLSVFVESTPVKFSSWVFYVGPRRNILTLIIWTPQRHYI